MINFEVKAICFPDGQTMHAPEGVPGVNVAINPQQVEYVTESQEDGVATIGLASGTIMATKGNANDIARVIEDELD